MSGYHEASAYSNFLPTNSNETNRTQLVPSNTPSHSVWQAALNETATSTSPLSQVLNQVGIFGHHETTAYTSREDLRRQGDQLSHAGLAVASNAIATVVEFVNSTTDDANSNLEVENEEVAASSAYNSSQAQLARFFVNTNSALTQLNRELASPVDFHGDVSENNRISQNNINAVGGLNSFAARYTLQSFYLNYQSYYVPTGDPRYSSRNNTMERYRDGYYSYFRCEPKSIRLAGSNSGFGWDSTSDRCWGGDCSGGYCDNGSCDSNDCSSSDICRI